MKLALLTSIIALLLAATSRLAAQITMNEPGQPLGTTTGRTTVTSPSTSTGVICEEEMTATFCNVVTSPSSGGYGTAGGAAATGAGIATPSPAIPTCSNFPPADELCN